MGVLVGTSLIVIIPEGVDTLYEAQEAITPHTKKSLSLTGLDVRWPVVQSEKWSQRRDAAEIMSVDKNGKPVFIDTDNSNAPSKDPPKTPTDPGVVGALGESSTTPKKEEHHGKSPHAWIGVALIAGFVLMYLVDMVPQATTSSKGQHQPYHISLNDLGRGFHRVTTNEDGEIESLHPENEHTSHNRSFATTIGLVIHAAADGIALGASSLTSNTGLSFIVFLAIMIHKAPAAFGLTSVLLRQGLSKRSARAHLLMFSLAAPTGALATWAFAHAIGTSRVSNAESTNWWTGMLLLFSGGTFLYVAMHTMQENSSVHSDQQMNGNANGYIEGRESGRKEEKPAMRDLAAAVFGMILPLILQVGDVH
ncbi:MAG: hypothetical protein Q9227_003173 [Pyrenula ochraceoflavens]